MANEPLEAMNLETEDVEPSDKHTNWENEPTITDFKNDLEAAQPYHDAQQVKIDHWSNLLNVTGAARPPKIKGRSSVQPKLIRKQAEWRYPALSEPFLSADKPFHINPVTFEDKEAAEQNQVVLNWQFKTKIDRVKLIDDFVRSTVDEGTSIARVGWFRKTQLVTEQVPVWDHFPIKEKQNLQILKQAIELKQSNPRMFNEKVSDAVKASVTFYEENGQPTVAMQSGTEEIESEEILENKPTVGILNPANVFIDPSCNGDLDNALFAIISFETNKSQLLSEGKKYFNLDLINWNSDRTENSQTHESNTPPEFTFKDASRNKVVAYEYWGFYDIHDTGILEPIVSTWIDNVLVRLEENPFPDKKIPLVLTTYTPNKRELYGEPDADLLEDNQKVSGAVTRGMIDLMGRSANSQQGFAKGMLDPINRRRFENGKDYEFNPNMHPQNGLIEHKYPEIPQSAMLMLQLQNTEAESLTGVKAFDQGLSSASYGQVATGIKGVLTASAQREMAIIRRLAKGLSIIGSKIVSMNAEFLSETETVRITNEEFVEINREDLKGNFDLDVDISTAATDNEKASDLGFMLQTIGPNMDPQLYTQLLSEIAELKRMPKLANDLRNYKPAPDPTKELESQKLQLEITKLQAEIGKTQSEIVENRTDAELNRAQTADNYADAQLKRLEFTTKASGVDHARDLEKQGAQAEANKELKVTEAILSEEQPTEEQNIAAAVGYNQLT